MNKLPRFGLGCAALPFGTTAAAHDAACSVIRHAAGLGVEWFDTSSLYSGGANEAGVGNALDGIPRDRYRLSTKAGFVMDDEARAVSAVAGPGNTTRDYSYDFVMWSVERSLQRLRTDRLDLAMVHDPINSEQVQSAASGGIRALCELRTQQVIAAVGAGMTILESMIELVEACEIDFLMLPCWYHLIDHSANETLLPRCQEKSIPVVVAGPFAGGLLANPYAKEAHYNYYPPTPDDRLRAQTAAKVCERHGVSIKAAAIQFPLRHQAVNAVMSGPKTIAELEENLELMAVEVPGELWQELGHALRAQDEFPPPSGDA
ncbi:MAG: aldo/keto reductase [Lentisphaeria bacterium]|nr:aldo/keto reductase [Lentisphaeria bacterium]